MSLDFSKEDIRELTEVFSIDSDNLNDFLVVEAIVLEKRPLSRTEIYTIQDMKRTTAFDALTRMIKAGVIKKQEVRNGKRGRPIVLFSLKEDFKLEV